MKRIRILIVEDEQGAANNLRYMLNEIVPEAQVMAVVPSIWETVKWLTENQEPDLAFFDIQLEDGLSFEIFRKTQKHFPVIFTTAFDQYAIEAFKVNSIDYLLKPIKESALAFSIRKYNQLKLANLNLALVERMMDHLDNKRLTSFLVHFRDRIVPLPVADIAYFKIEEKSVFAYTFDCKKYPLEEPLDLLEESMESQEYFRANRQVIINRKAVVDMELYFNGRLKINLNPAPDEMVLVSRARASLFKKWLKGVMRQ